MKIFSPPISTAESSGTAVVARGRKTALASGTAAQSSLQADATTAGRGSANRPVRISRFPEEAALFAYDRQARVGVEKPQAQIDEYV